jgi:DNA-binding transcriptional LysR family regulator
VAVAEELNFTRAAERLHLAQQALSTQIQQLEQRMDARLFGRTSRRVELTAAAAQMEALSAAFERLGVRFVGPPLPALLERR